MKKCIAIDGSYNHLTSDEVLDKTSGYDIVIVTKEYNQAFDLIWNLSDIGYGIYADHEGTITACFEG